MINKEKELIKICQIIKSHSGICVSGAHTEFLCSYINKRIEELQIGCDTFLHLVERDSNELTRLINQSTINETYFFREEKQFLHLKNNVFPQFKDRSVTIWSAACSTGEEVLSLAMLCDDCGIKARLYGTDIDSNALDILGKGEYNAVSVRTDGTIFHTLLDKYTSKNNGMIQVKQEIIDKVKYGTFNLHSFSGTAEIPPDGTVDIIFLRNVFIYFDEETRKKIISFMEKKLSPQGCLFFSMSEIASIIPDKKSSLTKQRHEMVYYLQKDAITLSLKAKIPEENFQKKSEKENKYIVKKIIRKKEENSTSSNSKKLPEEKNNHNTSDAVFSQITQCLEANRIEDAEKILESCGLQLDVQYLKSYYKGLIEKMKGNDNEALQWFERSAQMNPVFWTAHIQCAMLLNTKDPVKARRKYIRCAELLEKYIDEKSSKYDFLLESFSAEYFYTICTKNIEKGMQKCQ
jgi:chemotaxis protein methyltransferase CheR